MSATQKNGSRFFNFLRKTGILIVIYGLAFVFCKELYATYWEWQPIYLFVNHNKYNHSASPNFTKIANTGINKAEPFVMKINSQGLRENLDIQIPKPKGIYRILLVGDSFVFGGKIQLSKMLEKALNNSKETNIKFEVINCGTPSFSPILHIARLKQQHLSFDPDAIIYMPDLSDIYDDTHRYKGFAVFDENENIVKVKGSSRAFRAKRRHKRFIKKWATKFGLYQSTTRDITTKQKIHLQHIFDHARESESNLSSYTKDELQFSMNSIRQYVKITQAKGIHLSFIMYPHYSQIVPESVAYSSDFDGVHNRVFEKAVQNFAETANIPFKSLYDEIKIEVKSGKNLYYWNDMHFNNAGMRILGQALTNWVINHPEEAAGYTTGH